MDITIYFHRKDSHCPAFDCSDQVRSEIPHVFIQGKEGDFCQLRVILGGIYFKLDDVPHCRLESC